MARPWSMDVFKAMRKEYMRTEESEIDVRTFIRYEFPRHHGTWDQLENPNTWRLLGVYHVQEAIYEKNFFDIFEPITWLNPLKRHCSLPMQVNTTALIVKSRFPRLVVIGVPKIGVFLYERKGGPPVDRDRPKTHT
ncbi:hypothetical protein TNCV_2662451 [Trichonephila clavipes]|nr:hypothetical protein TNCV_2662451 [Trichonephila clavipes]